MYEVCYNNILKREQFIPKSQCPNIGKSWSCDVYILKVF